MEIQIVYSDTETITGVGSNRVEEVYYVKLIWVKVNTTITSVNE